MPRLLSVGEFRIRNLTKREVQILDLLVLGMDNQEIGDRLAIKRKTVENNITRIMEKVGMEKTGRRVLLALWYRDHRNDLER